METLDASLAIRRRVDGRGDTLVYIHARPPARQIVWLRNPPSTTMSEPVTKLAAFSLARYTAAPANSLPLNFCYERGLPEGAHLMNDVTLVKSPRGQNSHHAQSCIQAPSDKQVGSGRGQTVKDARAAGREGENRSAWRVR